MNEKELLELKREIDTAKTEKAELDGQKKSLMKRLKDEWDCSTIEGAEKYVEELEGDVKKLDEEINEGLAELDKYEL